MLVNRGTYTLIANVEENFDCIWYERFVRVPTQIFQAKMTSPFWRSGISNRSGSKFFWSRWRYKWERGKWSLPSKDESLKIMAPDLGDHHQLGSRSLILSNSHPCRRENPAKKGVLLLNQISRRRALKGDSRERGGRQSSGLVFSNSFPARGWSHADELILPLATPTILIKNNDKPKSPPKRRPDKEKKMSDGKLRHSCSRD